jgi:hypothetical protein
MRKVAQPKAMSKPVKTKPALRKVDTGRKRALAKTRKVR